MYVPINSESNIDRLLFTIFVGQVTHLHVSTILLDFQILSLQKFFPVICMTMLYL